MSRLLWLAALAWLVQRLFTLGLYMLAIVGATDWDRNPNSWILILIRLGATAMFLWWAVVRTIRHEREDADGDEP